MCLEQAGIVTLDASVIATDADWQVTLKRIGRFHRCWLRRTTDCRGVRHLSVIALTARRNMSRH
jgi:hypothetical protein